MELLGEDATTPSILLMNGHQKARGWVGGRAGGSNREREMEEGGRGGGGGREREKEGGGRERQTDG